MVKKAISLTVIFCFFMTCLGPIPKVYAEPMMALPVPGTMVNLSPAYEPALIKGLTVHKDNPFLFDFIVDTGHSKMEGDVLKAESDRLIKYFFACLTIPERDLWVNLSPYEKDRMVPQALGETALGRDLLAQDYILKQLTASLIYPEKELGRDFWDRVYAKAQQTCLPAGRCTADIPINTFNKVWIMADKATVYEHNQTAFVVDGHLKVMLEEDYLALQKSQENGLSSPKSSVGDPDTGFPTKAFGNDKATNALGSQIVREIILPEIEKEINTGKNFAQLRQIFNSLILATWYKKNLKEALLNQVYADKSTVNGVNLNDASDKNKIYQQYLQAYKKGVFNYIKEETDTKTQTTTPRKYFSGGFGANVNLSVTKDQMMGAKAAAPTGVDYAVTAVLGVNNAPVVTAPDAAMAVSIDGKSVKFAGSERPLNIALRVLDDMVRNLRGSRGLSSGQTILFSWKGIGPGQIREDIVELVLDLNQGWPKDVPSFTWSETELYIRTEHKEKVLRHLVHQRDALSSIGKIIEKVNEQGIVSDAASGILQGVYQFKDASVEGTVKAILNGGYHKQEGSMSINYYPSEHKMVISAPMGENGLKSAVQAFFTSIDVSNLKFSDEAMTAAGLLTEQQAWDTAARMDGTVLRGTVAAWKQEASQALGNIFPGIPEIRRAQVIRYLGVRQDTTAGVFKILRGMPRIEDMVQTIVQKKIVLFASISQERNVLLGVVDQQLPFVGPAERIEIAEQLKLSPVNEGSKVYEVVARNAAMTASPDKAVVAAPGGIDLNPTNMGMTVSKDANGGVKMDFDPVMIERVRRQGIQSVVPVIINIMPIADIHPLLGLAPTINSPLT